MGSLATAYEYVFGSALVVFVVAAIVSDVRHLLIPNWISIGLTGAFLLYALLAKDLQVLLWHVLVAAALFALGLLFFVLGWFGGGDVKLLAAVGLWAGPADVLPLVLIMSVTGALLSLAIMVLRAWLARKPERAERLPFAALATWAAQGVCPYGIAIGLATLATLPRNFF